MPATLRSKACLGADHRGCNGRVLVAGVYLDCTCPCTHRRTA